MLWEGIIGVMLRGDMLGDMLGECMARDMLLDGIVGVMLRGDMVEALEPGRG